MILGGAETGVTQYGQEGPCVLLSHCSLAHSGAWRGFVQALGNVAATGLDLPGHGRSVWDAARSPERQAVDAMLEMLEGGPAHLVGHSFGARVALKAAIERPERVLSVTAFEPMMFHLLDDVSDPLFAEEDAASAVWAEFARENDMDGAGRSFTALWGNGQPWDEIPERLRAYMRGCMPTVLASGPQVMGHPEGQITLEDLAALPMPSLLLSGSATRAGAIAICDTIEERCDIRHIVIEGAGHMAPITHPAEVAAPVAELIAEAQPALMASRN
ncbi:MAG: alpha/beta hydrolase [Pseudomonadota bacterium]